MGLANCLVLALGLSLDGSGWLAGWLICRLWLEASVKVLLFLAMIRASNETDAGSATSCAAKSAKCARATTEAFAGVVQLSPAHVLNDAELFDQLRRVDGVANVQFSTTKNISHFQRGKFFDRNLLVTPVGATGSSNPIEFEATMNKGSKKDRIPYSFSLSFKQPEMRLVP